MRILLILFTFFLMACNGQKKEEKPVKTNRIGDTYVSFYKAKRATDKNWYVILSFDDKGVYFYYLSSSKPVSDFFTPKWKTTKELPDELLNREPEEVLTVPLSELPADVVVLTPK